MKRPGKFFLNLEFCVENEDWEEMIKASGVQILLRDYDFESDKMVFLGLSPHFDEVKDGETPPVYHVEFSTGRLSKETRAVWMRNKNNEGSLT